MKYFRGEKKVRKKEKGKKREIRKKEKKGRKEREREGRKDGKKAVDLFIVLSEQTVS